MGEAVGSYEGGEEGLLSDFGVVFAGLCEALDGEVEGVAGGERRGVVAGDGGVDLEGLVGVELRSEFVFGFGDGDRGGGGVGVGSGGGGEVASLAECERRRHI